MEEMVKIPKEEYERLKMQAKYSNIDIDLLEQLISSLKDIKEGKVRRVR